MNECFVSRGSHLNDLMLIRSGRACVVVDGRQVQILKPGRFVDAISFLTDETAPTNVVALEPTRDVCWPTSRLKGYRRNNPELLAAIQAALGTEPHKTTSGHRKTVVTG